MDNNEELVDQEQATVDTTVVEGQETVTEASEVETLKATLSETEDRLLRLQAELANIQKRNAKERQDAAKFRSQSLAQELLPVMDSLERALAIEVEDEKSLNLKKGLEMVMNLFTEAFAKEGISLRSIRSTSLSIRISINRFKCSRLLKVKRLIQSSR